MCVAVFVCVCVWGGGGGGDTHGEVWCMCIAVCGVGRL